MSRRFAVVGASLAGVNAAERIEQLQDTAEIDLFDSQPYWPYDKPPLSKRSFRSIDHHLEIALRDEAFWAATRIRPRFGVEVAGLDRRSVRTGDGTVREYDGVVIATGGRPRRPAFVRDLPNVSVLRTIQDAVTLHAALVRGSRLVIVGGGFIGLELAAVAVESGVDVTVVEPFEVPLMRPIGAYAGSWIAERHREHGVRFVQAGVADLVGTVRAEGVLLSDGRTIPADHVLVCVGMVPNVEWLDGSAVEVDNGVICDEFLATSEPGVYAAGDVASWVNPVYGRRMRVEHLTTAVSQGRAAAENLVAFLDGLPRRPFAHVPYVWSDQYDMKIQTVGATGGDLQTTVEEETPNRLIMQYLENGEVVGALAINSPAYIMKLRRSFSAREITHIV